MMNDNRKRFSAFGVILIVLSIYLMSTSLRIFSYSNSSSDFLGNIIDVFLDLILLFIGIILISAPIYRDRKLQKLPELVSSAKLVSKGTEIRGRHTITIYYLTFELPDNSRKTFKVSSDIYNSVLKNETGVLAYKEQDKLIQFLDFKRNIP